MPDNLTQQQRRKAMRSVSRAGTAPELRLRRLLREAGRTGYRCNLARIVGKPDIAFIGARVALFVDGAFWHGHPDKYWPGRSGPYWDEKILRNQRRDREVTDELRRCGWTVIRIWDIDLEKDPLGVMRRVEEAFSRDGSQS